MTDLEDPRRREALRMAVVGGIGLGVTGLATSWFGWVQGAKAMHAAAKPHNVSAPLRSLLGARQWLNTQPLQPEDIHGKVVLVNFWTYSCINSLRMLPYTRAWQEKYRDRGLVVIGVHTPEFAFEKDIDKVSKASASLGVSYPVPLDSDYSIWRAFNNEAWPALYFIDADGHIRHRALGEGDYDKSEQLIQKLLSEADRRAVPSDIVSVSGVGPQAAPDEKDLRSPETYVGYAKATDFVSPGGVGRDVSTVHRGVSLPALNHWSLAGSWTVGKEFATLNDAPGSIAYRFHARDLHLVMGRSPQSHPVRFRVKIDGAPPGPDHGYDADAEALGMIDEDRMYQLVRQAGPVADRTFEIEYLDPVARAYVFTFG